MYVLVSCIASPSWKINSTILLIPKTKCYFIDWLCALQLPCHSSVLKKKMPIHERKEKRIWLDTVRIELNWLGAVRIAPSDKLPLYSLFELRSTDLPSENFEFSFHATWLRIVDTIVVWMRIIYNFYLPPRHPASRKKLSDDCSLWLMEKFLLTLIEHTTLAI